MNRRLYRSFDDRVVAGIAGGMAETYDLDPAVVRVGWVVLALLTGGVILVVYIVMALVVPLAPDDQPAGWSGARWPSSAEAGSQGGASRASESLSAADDRGPAEETTIGTPPTAAAGASSAPFISERVARRQRRRETRGHNSSEMGGALVFGLLLILVGAYFLLRDHLPAIAWGQLWPLVLIAIGLVLLLGAFRRRGE